MRTEKVENIFLSFCSTVPFVNCAGECLCRMQAVSLCIVSEQVGPVTHFCRMEKPCSLWPVNNLPLVHFYVFTEMF